MINETFQWAAIAIVAFLMLGAFRHISGQLPAPSTSSTFSGPILGERLPSTALSELEQVLGRGVPAEGFLVVFVAESCIACQTLLGQLSASQALEQGQRLALVTQKATDQFRDALREAGHPVLFDDGTLWEACRVTNTPLVLKLDGDGRVAAKGVTHHVDTVAFAA